jgi:hypothetical protein
MLYLPFLLLLLLAAGLLPVPANRSSRRSQRKPGLWNSDHYNPPTNPRRS